MTVQLLAVSPRTGRLDSDISPPSSVGPLRTDEEDEGIVLDCDGDVTDGTVGSSSCAHGLDSLGPLASDKRPMPPPPEPPPPPPRLLDPHDSFSGCSDNALRDLFPPPPPPTLPVPELVDATREPISFAAPESALIALEEN